MTSTVACAGRPRDERATRAILEAALHQVDSLGYGRMSMESVAAEAGVSRATVYRRYRDKADLVTAAIATVAVQPPAPGPRPLERLGAYLDEFDARFAASCLEVIGCLQGAHADPGAMEHHRALVVEPRLRAVRALLAEAQRGGELGRGADLDVLTEMLLGAVFARRVSGRASEPGWGRRAVAAVCVR